MPQAKGRQAGVIARWWANLPLRSKRFTGILIPVAALLFGFASIYTTQRVEDAAHFWVQHTQQVRYQIRIAVSTMLDAERTRKGSRTSCPSSPSTAAAMKSASSAAGCKKQAHCSSEAGSSCEHRPDLVLLSLNLPDMSGSEVLRRIKGEFITSDIPVVILSADATTRQIERLKAGGAAEYLVKPIDVKKLLRVVEEAFAQTGSRVRSLGRCSGTRLLCRALACQVLAALEPVFKKLEPLEKLWVDA